MKFTILTYGYEKMDTNGMFANDTIATASNPNCPHRLMDIPIWGILIQTEAHNIIYDLGCMEDCMEKYWSEGQKDRSPFTAEPGGIEGQLAKVGRIQRETGAEIMYSHWTPIFNEWKKAPFFYE